MMASKITCRIDMHPILTSVNVIFVICIALNPPSIMAVKAVHIFASELGANILLRSREATEGFPPVSGPDFRIPNQGDMRQCELVC
jgi:hypothetical protein